MFSPVKCVFYFFLYPVLCILYHLFWFPLLLCHPSSVYLLILTLCLSSCPPSTRPWDPLNDLIQFEKDGCIQTKVRHRTPMVRSGSLISLSNQGPRRDNCKCQVGCPDRKPTIFRKQKQHAASATFQSAPAAPSSLSLSSVWLSLLSPQLLLFIYSFCIFCFSFPVM